MRRLGGVGKMGNGGSWPSSCCAHPELGDLLSSSSLSAGPSVSLQVPARGPQDGSQAQSGLGACICKQEVAGFAKDTIPRLPRPIIAPSRFPKWGSVGCGQQATPCLPNQVNREYV